jgi:hypothetical protein
VTKLVDQGRRGRRVREAHTAGLEPLLQGRVEGIDVSAKLVPIRLAETAEPDGGDGVADTACQVAETGAGIGVFGGQGGIGQGVAGS